MQPTMQRTRDSGVFQTINFKGRKILQELPEPYTFRSRSRRPSPAPISHHTLAFQNRAHPRFLMLPVIAVMQLLDWQSLEARQSVDVLC